MEDTAVRDQHVTSPFAHIYKNRWKMAITTSLVVNCLLVGGLIWSFTQKPDLEIDKTPVEISILGDGPDTGGPKIAAPAKSAVQAPPPLTQEEVQSIQNGVPIKDMIEQPKPQPTPVQPTPSALNSSVDAAYSGGAGVGGSAEGSAEGSGSGSGDGSEAGGSGDGGEGTGGSQTVVEPLEFLGNRSLRGYSGTVVIHVVVNESGRAVEAYVEQSSGDSAYDRAAAARARSSAYSPKTVNGTPVVSEGRITFRN
ncbi:TonB family protein [uncultured Veillonella sp.]|uniref:TonB family protein n=1 Tax=uncultured Veillonella sp. TaxID=159268 RepID=UPI0025D424CD|nr:TonB family protein [uncultured Veillonella sp.]